ncbi:MAG: 2-oxo acid dehydrogenase subunit E2 [Gemmatimonadales bacterium]|nr:2-oxo acid dehydrogenase subunit E2 [Gemmatimonadales bacterium]
MAELTDIVLPHDQSEGTSNTVGKWFKGVGEPVRKDDPLLEIITDKVTVEIAAPADGVLVEIVKAEGEAVEQGEVLGRLGAGAGAGAGEIASGALRPRNDTPAIASLRGGPPEGSLRGGEAAEAISPAVRRLLQEHGLQPSQIPGSGRGGRITVQDVEAFLAAGSSGGHRLAHSAMRKSIAEHMVRSVATAPHVTAVFEADLSGVAAHRAQQSEKMTYTAYFVRATVAALKAVPEVNSRWHADALELFDHCNIGIATALDGGGLIVPVLANAEQLDLHETARRLTDLTSRARAGKLEPKDVQGGTFTISNHGVSGSLLAAPIIINQPQSAILGVGKMEQRVRVTSTGSFEARPMCYVTLTIDHRVLDGFQANAFLTAWVTAIETAPAG